jgi:hypothetical protein
MIHPYLHLLVTQTRVDDLRRTAAAHRSASSARPAVLDTSPVTVRFGFPDDTDAIARLAKLDSSKPPTQPTLVAEIGGQLRAALSLSTGSVIADPFHPSAQLVELLRVRARQLRDARRPRRLARLGLRRRLVPQPTPYR